jgi:hypothetical protein
MANAQLLMYGSKHFKQNFFFCFSKEVWVPHGTQWFRNPARSKDTKLFQKQKGTLVKKREKVWHFLTEPPTPKRSLKKNDFDFLTFLLAFLCRARRGDHFYSVHDSVHAYPYSIFTEMRALLRKPAIRAFSFIASHAAVRLATRAVRVHVNGRTFILLVCPRKCDHTVSYHLYIVNRYLWVLVPHIIRICL